MKIHAFSFALAASITFSALYTLFALALKFFPTATLRFIGTVHMIPRLDYIKSFVTVTPQSIAIGMISHIVLIFVLFWVIAELYNVFQRPQQ